MYFSDISMTTTNEQVRAWCVEKAIEINDRRGRTLTNDEIIDLAKEIYDYVRQKKVQDNG